MDDHHKSDEDGNIIASSATKPKRKKTDEQKKKSNLQRKAKRKQKREEKIALELAEEAKKERKKFRDRVYHYNKYWSDKASANMVSTPNVKTTPKTPGSGRRGANETRMVQYAPPRQAASQGAAMVVPPLRAGATSAERVAHLNATTAALNAQAARNASFAQIAMSQNQAQAQAAQAQVYQTQGFLQLNGIIPEDEVVTFNDDVNDKENMEVLLLDGDGEEADVLVTSPEKTGETGKQAAKVPRSAKKKPPKAPTPAKKTPASTPSRTRRGSQLAVAAASEAEDVTEVFRKESRKEIHERVKKMYAKTPKK